MLRPNCDFGRDKVLVNLRVLYLPENSEIKTDYQGDPSDGYPILGGHAFEDVFDEPFILDINEKLLSLFGKTHCVKVIRDTLILIEANASIGQYSDGIFSNGMRNNRSRVR